MNQLTKRKVILYLAIIFVAGGISGAVIGWGSAREARSRPPTMGHMCDHMRKRLQSHLNLSPDQLQKIEPILQKTAKQMEAIHRKTIDEIERLLQQSNAEIAKELNPDQIVKLEELDKERREYFSRRFKGGPPPR